jgi:hypothetical protein
MGGWRLFFWVAMVFKFVAGLPLLILFLPLASRTKVA